MCPLALGNAQILWPAGEGAEDGAPLSDADKAHMFQAALQSLQIQLGEKGDGVFAATV